MLRLHINLFFLLTFLCSAPAFANGHECDPEANVCMMSYGNIKMVAAENSYSSSNFPQTDDEDQLLTGGDLSDEGERTYVAQIRNWLSSLPENQRKTARSILREAHPELQNLRREIYSKKNELADICFDDTSSLERLPKLGMDLQKLRKSLRDKLEIINTRLLNEAGVKMDQLAGEGLWLQPLPRTKVQPSKSYRLSNTGLPVSMLNDLPAELQY